MNVRWLPVYDDKYRVEEREYTGIDGKLWYLYVDNEYKGIVVSYTHPVAYHMASSTDSYRNYNCKSMHDAAVELMNYHGLKTSR